MLKENIDKYLQRLENGLKETDPDNYSVYTGSAGRFMLVFMKIKVTLFKGKPTFQLRVFLYAGKS